jgi:hypothetical protein
MCKKPHDDYDGCILSYMVRLSAKMCFCNASLLFVAWLFFMVFPCDLQKTLKEWGGTHSKTTLSEGWNHGCSMAPMQRCSWGLQRMVLALKKWGLVLQQSTSTIDPFFDIFLVI